MNRIKPLYILSFLLLCLGFFDLTFAQSFTPPSPSAYIPTNGSAPSSTPPNYVSQSSANTEPAVRGGINTTTPTQTSCQAQGMDYSVMANRCVKNQAKISQCESTQCQNYEGAEYTACSTKCNANPDYKTNDPDENNGMEQEDKTVMGITIGPKCLKNGQCGLNIYELLGMKNRDGTAKSSSATTFIQDILLSATFFIGTILTIALIYSGIMFIVAGASGKEPTNAKNGIMYSIIGLLIVITSYSLIRLVQYIAKGM